MKIKSLTKRTSGGHKPDLRKGARSIAERDIADRIVEPVPEQRHTQSGGIQRYIVQTNFNPAQPFGIEGGIRSGCVRSRTERSIKFVKGGQAPADIASRPSLDRRRKGQLCAASGRGLPAHSLCKDQIVHHCTTSDVGFAQFPVRKRPMVQPAPCRQGQIFCRLPTVFGIDTQGQRLASGLPQPGELPGLKPEPLPGFTVRRPNINADLNLMPRVDGWAQFNLAANPGGRRVKLIERWCRQIAGGIHPQNLGGKFASLNIGKRFPSPVATVDHAETGIRALAGNVSPHQSAPTIIVKCPRRNLKFTGLANRYDASGRNRPLPVPRRNIDRPALPVWNQHIAIPLVEPAGQHRNTAPERCRGSGTC